jgi:hypothetical protein
MSDIIICCVGNLFESLSVMNTLLEHPPSQRKKERMEKKVYACFD